MLAKNRSLIHLIARHSSLKEAWIDRLLDENVHPKKHDWFRFLRFSILALGIGFSLSGILFFFAYNWDGLHKFVKIGIVEGVLVVVSLLALRPSFPKWTRQLLLTAAAVLTGILFAVFGQVYQTGANAFDLFLTWSIAIVIWVFVADFSMLWLGFIILLNVTLMSYADQLAPHWPPMLSYVWQFLLDVIAVGGLFWGRHKFGMDVPRWLTHTVTILAVSISTVGLINGIFGVSREYFPVLILLSMGCYAMAMGLGIRNKILFYPAVISLSLIILVAAILIKISDGQLMFLLVSLYIAVAVSVVIRWLLQLQKKWKNVAGY